MAGTENNLLLFEFPRFKPHNLPDIVDNYSLIRAVEFDVVILASSERGFGLKKQIHVWLTAKDFDNANHMVLLANVIANHKDWKRCEIKVFAVYPEENMEADSHRLTEMTKSGELPFSAKNIEFINQPAETDVRTIMKDRSQDADLCIIGFRSESVRRLGAAVFENYELNGNILFVNAASTQTQ